MDIVKAEKLLRRCMKEPFCINFEEFREAIKIILEARDILINQNIEYNKTLEKLQKDTIWKDKIREKIEVYKETAKTYPQFEGVADICIKELKELLEE